ncbi:MAG TPA: tetratricopeptide repeat protein [Drouetiella sp.]
MTEQERIKTDFMDRQAREISTPMLQKGPVRIAIAIVVIGVIFGIYSAVTFFINLPKNSAINNVAVNLQDPDLQDGIARVDVTVTNLNTFPVDHVKFKYTISGPDGNAAATGDVGVDEQNPAGASRRFHHVKLGPLAGEAARMKAELTDLKMGPKPNLSPELDSRFTEVLTMRGEEQLPQLKQFVAQAPDFAPGYIAYGRALVGDGNSTEAVTQFKKAVELDPKSADAHYELGLALLSKNDRADAEKEIGTAYDIAPNDPNIQRTIQENRK